MKYKHIKDSTSGNYYYPEVISQALDYLSRLINEAEDNNKQKTYIKNQQDLQNSHKPLKFKVNLALDILEEVNIYNNGLINNKYIDLHPLEQKRLIAHIADINPGIAYKYRNYIKQLHSWDYAFFLTYCDIIQLALSNKRTWYLNSNYDNIDDQATDYLKAKNINLNQKDYDKAYKHFAQQFANKFTNWIKNNPIIIPAINYYLKIMQKTFFRQKIVADNSEFKAAKQIKHARMALRNHDWQTFNHYIQFIEGWWN